jgi:hypothetical protein
MILHSYVKNKKALESFSTVEQRFKEVHGDIYDYDKSIYKNNTFKIEIICKIHNKPFMQTPSSHLEGSGCPICSRDRKRMTLDEFLDKAKNIHGDTPFPHSTYSYLINIENPYFSSFP